MQITWHGHSCFEFSDGETTVVTDPHDGRSIGIRPPSVTADIVLMSHDHYDHNASRAISGDHKDHKFHNGRFEYRGIQFYGYSTFHDTEKGTKRGLNTMYKFTMDGISVCHCGDLGDIPNDQVIKQIRDIDILLIPVGGYYTMELDVIKRFIEMVNPTIVIPMHYRTGGLTIDIASIDGFLRMILEDNIVYVGNSIDVLKEDIVDTKECWVFDRK